MKLDADRIKHLLYEIKENSIDLENILAGAGDDEIVSNKSTMKVIKYSLIEISEGISLVLQHILAKHYGQPVKGYIDAIKKAAAVKIVSENIEQKLKPFFDFRNSLIHRYWNIDNKVLIQNCRKGYADFYAFIAEIEEFMKKESSKSKEAEK